MVSVKGWRREARNSSEKAESQVPLETQRWWLHRCCSTSLERPEDGKDSAFQSPRAASWCGRGDHFLACAHGGANRPASSHQGEPGQPTAVTGAGSGSEARGGVEGFTASSRTKGASEGKGGGTQRVRHDLATFPSLVPQPGIEPMPPKMESSNHWETRQFPLVTLIFYILYTLLYTFFYNLLSLTHTHYRLPW